MADEAAFPWTFPAVSLGDDARARALEEALPACTTLAFRVAYSVLRHRQDAEDVAQEVLIKALRSWRDLRDPSRLRPWLVRAAFRRALDNKRSDRRRAHREGALDPAPGAWPESDPAAAEFRGRVFRAIDALPERLRLVLILSALEGHATPEVAALLSVPEGTVKSRLHLARRALQERLR
jgi:RNA polymerase sigma-70 factor (ECF subfamily)